MVVQNMLHTYEVKQVFFSNKNWFDVFWCNKLPSTNRNTLFFQNVRTIFWATKYIIWVPCIVHKGLYFLPDSWFPTATINVLGRNTVCPWSSDPIYIVGYYIKWVTTSWTDSMMVLMTWRTIKGGARPANLQGDRILPRICTASA